MTGSVGDRGAWDHFRAPENPVGFGKERGPAPSDFHPSPSPPPSGLKREPLG